MSDSAVPEQPTAAAPPSPTQINWDKVTALMAIFIGVCALGLSWYTALLQRAQVKAQTWPYLQLWQSDAQRSFSLSNRGVGPAQIRDVTLRVDGKEMPNFNAAFQALSGRPLDCAQQSYFSRRVLAANEDVTTISFCNDADYQVFAQAGTRLTRKVCYCSLLNDCSQIDEAAENELSYHISVPQCPTDKAGIFR